MIAPERLYLTADRCRVVKVGDPAAAFLLAQKGDEIPPRFLALISARPEVPTIIGKTTRKRK